MTVSRAYEVLGLDATRASADQVRARFRDLIRAHHPDRAPMEEQARANELTRQLVEAYTLLRERGYPRASREPETAWSDAEGYYEPQEAPEPVPADPFAWVDELWEESVRRGPPENAMTNAVARAAWWSTGGFTSIALGVVILVGGVLSQEWILAALAAVWTMLGIRLGIAALRISRDAVRFWKAWSRVAEPAAVSRVHGILALRFITVLGVAGALVMIAIRLL